VRHERSGDGARGRESRGLWANRDFNVFWFGQTLSELGNAFALVALPLLVLPLLVLPLLVLPLLVLPLLVLPLLVLRATGSVAQMGLLTAIAGVGSICTGLFAGSLVDRLDRRRLMILCDLARIMLYGLIPVCWAVRPQVWLLYLVMALTSVFDMTFKVTYMTAVSNLVDGDRIVAANGRLETTNAIAYIVGPMLAGVV
jgi:MFS family permease